MCARACLMPSQTPAPTPPTAKTRPQKTSEGIFLNKDFFCLPATHWQGDTTSTLISKPYPAKTKGPLSRFASRRPLSKMPEVPAWASFLTGGAGGVTRGLLWGCEPITLSCVLALACWSWVCQYVVVVCCWIGVVVGVLLGTKTSIAHATDPATTRSPQ